MNDDTPKSGEGVRAFSVEITDDIPFERLPSKPQQFVECHLQPVPKTVTLYSFEVEGGLGFTAHPPEPTRQRSEVFSLPSAVRQVRRDRPSRRIRGRSFRPFV